MKMAMVAYVVLVVCVFTLTRVDSNKYVSRTELSLLEQKMSELTSRLEQLERQRIRQEKGKLQ